MMYAPCRNGLHVCGISADDEEFVTVANAPGVGTELFDALAQQYAISVDDPDLVVDLMVDGDIIRDFKIRRQSLLAILQACE